MPQGRDIGIVSRTRRLLASEGFNAVAKLVGRLLLGLPFVVFGSLKIRNMESMTGYIESGGLPGEVIYLVIPLQIIGGLAVWLGLRTRWAAFLLGGFCVTAASIYHSDLSDLGQLDPFTKDFATAGGFLFLWVVGPGRYSLDAWLARGRT